MLYLLPAVRSPAGGCSQNSRKAWSCRNWISCGYQWRQAEWSRSLPSSPSRSCWKADGLATWLIKSAVWSKGCHQEWLQLLYPEDVWSFCQILIILKWWKCFPMWPCSIGRTFTVRLRCEVDIEAAALLAYLNFGSVNFSCCVSWLH